jgi:hypothetical protein
MNSKNIVEDFDEEDDGFGKKARKWNGYEIDLNSLVPPNFNELIYLN